MFVPVLVQTTVLVKLTPEQVVGVMAVTSVGATNSIYPPVLYFTVGVRARTKAMLSSTVLGVSVFINMVIVPAVVTETESPEFNSSMRLLPESNVYITKEFVVPNPFGFLAPVKVITID